jgi:hypothetical protein
MFVRFLSADKGPDLGDHRFKVIENSGYFFQSLCTTESSGFWVSFLVGFGCTMQTVFSFEATGNSDFDSVRWLGRDHQLRCASTIFII